MPTRELLTRPEKCTGCLICQLQCSFTYEGVFDPTKARILIEGFDDKKISFTKDCNNCGICARYCPYGALEFRIKGEKVEHWGVG